MFWDTVSNTSFFYSQWDLLETPQALKTNKLYVKLELINFFILMWKRLICLCSPGTVFIDSNLICYAITIQNQSALFRPFLSVLMRLNLTCKDSVNILIFFSSHFKKHRITKQLIFQITWGNLPPLRLFQLPSKSRVPNKKVSRENRCQNKTKTTKSKTIWKMNETNSEKKDDD